MRRVVGRFDRVVGTALNLVSSAAALALFRWLTRMPLDYWDIGMQVAIAICLELVILGVILRVGLSPTDGI